MCNACMKKNVVSNASYTIHETMPPYTFPNNTDEGRETSARMSTMPRWSGERDVNRRILFLFPKSLAFLLAERTSQHQKIIYFPSSFLLFSFCVSISSFSIPTSNPSPSSPTLISLTLSLPLSAVQLPPSPVKTASQTVMPR